MKKRYNKKSCAILLLGIITLVATTTSQAQNDTVNPLVASTGPNVLDQGHLQWNSKIYGERYRVVLPITLYLSPINCYGTSTGLRYGIGNKAELTAKVAGYQMNYKPYDTSAVRKYVPALSPSLGVRMQLYEGNRWLPQIAYSTVLAFSNVVDDNNYFQATIGLQFRNKLADRWMLDYSVSYSWSKYTSAVFYKYDRQPFQYSLLAKWLASDRLMLGMGIENGSAYLDALWQVSPDLQLYTQVNAQIDRIHYTSYYGLLLGVNWMLK